jgi:hypothetical protein
MRTDYIIGGFLAMIVGGGLILTLVLAIFGVILGLGGFIIFILGFVTNPPQPRQAYYPPPYQQPYPQGPAYQGEIKYCQTCGTQNPRAAQFCQRCGNRFPQ